MTPRERWLALLAGEKPDRVPTDYWATPEVTERLLRESGCATLFDLYDRLHIDGVRRIPLRRTVDHHPDDPAADVWGVRATVADYGSGTYREFGSHPLAGVTTVEEVDAFAWPDAANHDWDRFRAEIEAAPRDRVVQVGDFEPFLIYCAMDNQRTMPFGSVGDVRREVRENLRIFEDARWICAPCHNLQPVTPTENILALYETVHEEGRA